MKNYVASILIGAGVILAATLADVHVAHAEQVKDADKLVHQALKNRTNTFCKQVLPAWIKQKGGQNSPVFRTLVADCYLGYARLTILGVDGMKAHLKNVGLSELPSALLAREAGMNLDIYRPLAGRTLKDYAKSK